MFKIGEQVFYGGHGVCVIEEITEMTFSNETKQFYKLKSHTQPQLSLFHPVETDQPKISKMMAKEEAQQILNIFKEPASEWTERSIDRAREYKKILETKDSKQIAQMINTILRKEKELVEIDKKLYAQDQEVIRQVYAILCDELSICLNLTREAVVNEITNSICITN